MATDLHSTTAGDSSSICPSTRARVGGKWIRRGVLIAAIAAISFAGWHQIFPVSAAHAADAEPVLKFPEPSLAPISWELTFRHGVPKRIVVQLPNQKYPTAYWYVTYTVMNLGDKEQTFDPDFSMVAANGKEYFGNRAISTSVFEEIKRREANPLLIAPRKAVGLINIGKEQARDSVAIWEEPVRKMGTFSIFVAGLSGETAMMKKVGDKYVVVDPAKAGDELKDVKDEDRLTLRKQFQMTYHVVGDENNVGNDPVVKKAETWVMK